MSCNSCLVAVWTPCCLTVVSFSEFEVEELGILFLKFSSFITREPHAFITGALKCSGLKISTVVQKESMNSNGQKAKGQEATASTKTWDSRRQLHNVANWYI